jgi:hypothetical protein
MGEEINGGEKVVLHFGTCTRFTYLIDCGEELLGLVLCRSLKLTKMFHPKKLINLNDRIRIERLTSDMMMMNGLTILLALIQPEREPHPRMAAVLFLTTSSSSHRCHDGVELSMTMRQHNSLGKSRSPHLQRKRSSQGCDMAQAINYG